MRTRSSITKREILFSIIVVFLMIFFGSIISEKIYNSVVESNEFYYKSVKIDNNTEQFTYGMRTSIGNALVYGKFQSDGEVNIPELSNGYFSIDRRTERYTKHTRLETYKIGDVTHTRVVTYYTWDEINKEVEQVDNVLFLNTSFPSSKFDIENYRMLQLNKDTVSSQYSSWINGVYLYKDGDMWANVGDLRYAYYVVPLEFNGSILTSLKDNSIFGVNGAEKIEINYEQNIQQVIEQKQSDEDGASKGFWIFWIILTVVGVGFFYYVDNDWLEDRRKRYRGY